MIFSQPRLQVYGFLLTISALVIAFIGLLLSPRIGAAAFAVIGLVVVFLLPRNALPAIALWLLVLVPVGYMDLPRMFGRYATPAVLVVAIWMIRLALAHRTDPSSRPAIRGGLIVVPLFGLLLMSTLFSGLDTARSLAWMTVVSICVVAPALLGQISTDDAWPTVRRTFAGIGLFLGVIALAEYYFGLNPWTDLFRTAVNEQAFSFVRTKTSLGHPLITSTVASVALVVSVFPAGRSREWPYRICAVGALAAVVLSVSRGGLIALICAVTVGMVALLAGERQSGERGRRRLASVLLAAAFLASIAGSPLLAERLQSTGAQKSADYRFTMLENTGAIVAESPFLGVGPGASDVVYTDLYGWGMESSALQLVVSVGVPAFVLFVLGLGGIVVVAMRRSRAGASAGIVAFFVAITGFNAINSNPALLALVAPLVFCAVVPLLPSKADSDEPPLSGRVRHSGDRSARDSSLAAAPLSPGELHATTESAVSEEGPTTAR